MSRLLSKFLVLAVGRAELDGFRNHGPETCKLFFSPSKDLHHDGAAYLDGLGIKLKTVLLVGKEFLDIFALITLQLDHLAHLAVDDDSAIASWDILSAWTLLLFLDYPATTATYRISS
jgi:hypothetical protein